MKICLVISIALFFIACAAPAKVSVDAPKIPDNAIIEKNKQTAVLNEVSSILRDSQTIEKVGRNMASYRIYPDAKSRRECDVVMEYNQRDVTALETRINKLSDNYKNQLTPLIPILNECVSCAKNAQDSCVKARASANQLIKEIYP